MANKLLRKLALSENSKAVIFHADDIGFSNSSIRAVCGLIEFGLLSSASVMMPCPWAPKALETFKKYPDFCVGIHLTLTCEYEHYRWGGLSTSACQPGLCNQFGHLRRSVAEVLQHATAESVATEIDIQISSALAAGLNPSHIDSHMGTVFAPPYIANYFSMYAKYGVPLFVPRVPESELDKYGFDAQGKQALLARLDRLEDSGMPVMDSIRGLELSGPYQDRVDQVKNILQTLEPGTITHFVCHPAVASDEMRAITPSWQHRNADYEVFLSSELKRWVSASGIEIVSYRDIQAAL